MGPPLETPYRDFIERLLIILAVAIASLTLWWLRDLLIVIFGAAVTAVLLCAAAEPVARATGLPWRMSLALDIGGMVGAAALLAFLFGSEISRQFSDLARDIPEGWRDVKRFLDGSPLGRDVAAMIGGIPDHATIVGRFGSLILTVGNVLLDFVLVAAGAVFFAAHPRQYVEGFLKLFPAYWRVPVREAVEDSGRALRQWLKAQLVSIVIVGFLTWLGLTLAGVPAAFALGIVAACAEVVPYVGPIVSAIPGLLLAILVGPETAGWALFVYVSVQQLEGNVVQPLVQNKVVTLPPAVTLFGMVAAGLLFGFIGVVFAAPAAVVGYVLLKRLYVRELLATEASVPGEPAGDLAASVDLRNDAPPA